LENIDWLVGTVGTGGSMCGIGERLRARLPNLKIAGVDTHKSAVFGQPVGPRTLRGLGNSLVPENVRHELFDEVHWVSAAEAYCATRMLHRESGLYMGGTSGAAWMVARWIAANHPEAKVLVLLPDEGYRYEATIYHDAWLHALKGWTGKLPEAPDAMHHPAEAHENWCRIAWRRQSLEAWQEQFEAA
jgi:cysteine synthase A